MDFPKHFWVDGKTEWDDAWAALYTEAGHQPSEPCPCCGEDWQYMGSTLHAIGNQTANFRHRHHPSTGGRIYENVRYGVLKTSLVGV